MKLKRLVILLIIFLCHQTGCAADTRKVDTGKRSIASRLRMPLTGDKGSEMVDQGEFLAGSGRYWEAERLFKNALAYWQSTHPRSLMYKPSCLNSLGQLYERQRKFDQAVFVYNQALSEEEAFPGDENILALKTLTLNNLSRIYCRQKNFAAAEPLYKQSLAIADKITTADDPDRAMAMFDCSLLYLAEGRYALSEPMMVKSMATLKKICGENNPTYVGLCPYYVTLLRKTNRKQQADEFEKKHRYPH